MHVALAGHLASGKSSFARALAESSGAGIASFGAYVRELTAEENLDIANRSNLQDVGQRLATGDPVSFFAKFLARYGLTAKTAIIFDGVRHLPIWSAIRAHATSLAVPSHLVFLSTDPDVRRARLIARGHASSDVAQWMAHAMEQELAPVAKAATIVIDGAAPMADNLRKFHTAAGVISD